MIDLLEKRTEEFSKKFVSEFMNTLIELLSLLTLG